MDGKTYVASGDVTINNDITVKGNVSLILLDGAKLTINGSIIVGKDNVLNIYVGSTTHGTILGNGILNAKGDSANDKFYAIGIGGNSSHGNSFGKLMIHGGIINASGGEYAAGIG